jgi:hypothetical protein
MALQSNTPCCWAVQAAISDSFVWPELNQFIEAINDFSYEAFKLSYSQFGLAVQLASQVCI